MWLYLCPGAWDLTRAQAKGLMMTEGPSFCPLCVPLSPFPSPVTSVSVDGAVIFQRGRRFRSSEVSHAHGQYLAGFRCLAGCGFGSTLRLSDPVPGSQPYVVFPGETLPGGSASNLTHVPLAVLMGEIVEGVSDACDGFLRFSDKSKQGNHTGTWNLPAAGGIMASTSFILSVT